MSISCIQAGDVSLLGPAGCDLGPLHFDQFFVSAQGQHNFEAAVFIAEAPYTNVTAEQTSGGQATLGFHVAHTIDPVTGKAPGLADILFSYRASTISGNILLGGISLANGGVGPVSIHERACKTAFTILGSCSQLADLVVPANGFLEERFTPDADVHEIFILKDILLNKGAFISDFSNSHELGALEPVPEPGSSLASRPMPAASGREVPRPGSRSPGVRRFEPGPAWPVVPTARGDQADSARRDHSKPVSDVWTVTVSAMHGAGVVSRRRRGALASA